MLGYLNLSNESFKRFYEGLKRIGEELPHKSTEETEVRDCSSPELKYEAIFLVKWATSNNVRVTPYYTPILSAERKRANLTCDALVRLVISRNHFAELLAAFNPMSEDLLKLRLSDAVRLQEITPIPGTQDLDYSIDIEDRNYEYRTIDLINWTIQNGFTLPEELSSLAKPSVTEDPDPRRINSLEKMVLGMAMTHYGYDPDSNKNSATGTNSNSIGEDLDRLGLGLKDDTIRNILKTASQRLKPNKR